ncbi:FAD-binding protein [Mailhella massiliensis]|uniref:FAD-binding protein n=1 Tax=Mailhella massiliensis TaxID=1903261 RepID=UPI00097DDBC2|nr:FAD-binding protein [Mailhella massiliensis]
MTDLLNRDIISHETDVLVLGGGASGCAAALAAHEAGLHAMIVDKGLLESCGCIGGGNDHFMAVLNSDEPYDSVEDLVRFYDKPGSGLHPETVRAWGQSMPHMLDFLAEAGIEFRRNPDGSFMRTQGFGQPGHWWILIHHGQYMKPLIAKKIRAMGIAVLDRIMVTKLIIKNGRFAGAMGYNVLDGTFHNITAKTAVMALGPRVERVTFNSTTNPYNSQLPPYITGSQYVLPYEAGARITLLDVRQTSSVLPKSFGSPGMNGITGSGAHALNFKGERFMTRYHPMTEQAPRHLFSRGTYCEQIIGNGPPFYMDMRHLPDDVRDCLEHDLMPGDKATFPDYAAQKGVDFTTKLMEVEVGELNLDGMVDRDANFESTIPGLFVGSGFHAFSGAMCGGYAAGQFAAKAAADMKNFSGKATQEELEEERSRVLRPLYSDGDTTHEPFESAIRQVMSYYMGYVRNEKGMLQALDSLNRIAALKDDLYAENMHELMRIHEAFDLLTMCRLATLCTLERKETSANTVYLRTDYPNPDPSLNKVLAVQKVDGHPKVFWLE